MRKDLFTEWLIRNNDLGKPSDYVSRVSRVEKHTLGGADIDLVLAHLAEDEDPAATLLETLTLSGNHNLQFRPHADVKSGLASLRTAITAYCEFWSEYPVCAKRQSEKVIHKEVQSLSVEEIRDIFLWRLQTQDRAYPLQGSWLFYTPRIYGRKTFAQLVGKPAYFRNLNKKLIAQIRFLIDQNEQYRSFTELEGIRVVESGSRRIYRAKFVDGGEYTLQSRTADGKGFFNLYQEKYSDKAQQSGEFTPILHSLTLDHVEPLQNLFARLELPGMRALSNIILDVAVNVTSSIHNWLTGEIIEKVLQHPDFKRELALQVKQDIETIYHATIMEVMQRSENSKKGKNG